ncbi:hypothetical protein [Accumulibacter sp.]|nr:hypothetical protein [Accumulibacter sp.]HRF03120.1 hypothetical protein [Accumulibacter sp.]
MRQPMAKLPVDDSLLIGHNNARFFSLLRKPITGKEIDATRLDR